MGPTRIRVLLTVAFVSGAVAWVMWRFWARQAGGVPPLTPAVPVALALLACTVLVLAWNLRRRLKGDPRVRPFDPLAAARLVALAKASSYAGALLAGLYGGLAVMLLPDVDVLARQVVVSGLATLAAVAVTASGLVLEWVCKVRPPEDEQPVTTA